MRVLFLNTPRADYLQGMVYSGLCAEIGAENIYCLPFNPKFHFPLRQYPRNLAYTKETLWGSIKSQLLKNLKQFNYDFVVVAASTPDCFRLYQETLPLIPKDCPVVFLDGGDRPEIGGDLIRLGEEKLLRETLNERPFNLVFKREVLTNNERIDHSIPVIPLPFCFNFDRLPKAIKKFQEEKKYDVSFWASESHPIRVQALELIQDQFDCRQNHSVRGVDSKKFPFKGKKYLPALANSKIALNFRGGGWDTLRYWEIPAVKTLMISQRPQIEIPNNFEDKKSVVFCDDNLDNLLDLCQYYLKHETERNRIVQNAYEHSLKFHTPRCRAQSVIANVSRL